MADFNESGGSGEKMPEQHLKVAVPEGNGYSDPSTVSRIVDHFKQLHIDADFVSENGLPVKTADGAYTVVVSGDARSKRLATITLETHYGLRVSEE